ncbi:flagellar protein [Paenibacillus tyrfis]|uniref:Flagellar protein n=2 Tax=Paenibacillus tyrfis TaxID=1501230 RepID=A0A081PA15_9BACL|nr:flagellar protein [Paenibacillus tyrfis]
MLRRLIAKLLSGVAMVWMQTAVSPAAVCFAESENQAPSGAGMLGTPDRLVTEGSSGGTFWMIFQVLFFLLLIIGIFLVIVKMISQKNKFLSGRSIRSLGGLPLGQNKSIQVVEIGRSLYIVGVGENIQLLEKIEDETEVALITELMSSGPAFAGPAFDSIGGWLKNLRNKPAVEEDMEVTASFQEVFHTKIQHMSDQKKQMEQLLKQDTNSDRLNDK